MKVKKTYLFLYDESPVFYFKKESDNAEYNKK